MTLIHVNGRRATHKGVRDSSAEFLRAHYHPPSIPFFKCQQVELPSALALRFLARAEWSMTHQLSPFYLLGLWLEESSRNFSKLSSFSFLVLAAFSGKHSRCSLDDAMTPCETFSVATTWLVPSEAGVDRWIKGDVVTRRRSFRCRLLVSKLTEVCQSSRSVYLRGHRRFRVLWHFLFSCFFSWVPL